MIVHDRQDHAQNHIFNVRVSDRTDGNWFFDADLWPDGGKSSKVRGDHQGLE